MQYLQTIINDYLYMQYIINRKKYEEIAILVNFATKIAIKNNMLTKDFIAATVFADIASDINYGRHTLAAYEFLHGIGLDSAAQIAKYHHELPSMNGLLKPTKYNVSSNFIHIASIILEAIKLEMPLSTHEICDNIEKKFYSSQLDFDIKETIKALQDELNEGFMISKTSFMPIANLIDIT